MNSSSEKDFHSHPAPCKDYDDQRPDGITYCPSKRNPAFTNKRHLIYGPFTVTPFRRLPRPLPLTSLTPPPPTSIAKR